MSGANADRIIAKELEKAGSWVSGLVLDEINEDAHQIANTLWRVSAYLRKRAANG